MKAGFFLAATLLVFPGDVAFAMRCGTSLVIEGQSKYEVLRLCGEPAYADSRVEYRWAPNWTGPRPLDGPANHYPSPAVRRLVYDEWVYNFGYTQLMPSLIFENGRLIEIRSLGYGR
ncbi:DUF2845 domain-containing protein [Methylocystis sp. WRRC1]|uniref:DUF2845 domain-containing protein n=1 Tax=unclassified Methylocystis TaxID=2625913 RepID=UPI0001F877E5|nr:MULTISPECIES: DUF2845 domain-containing protein [unclassified Methylocystis]MCC3243843.1 DUF2845 domain-containing protein [Methylocystis sp. WRRC1]